MLGTQFQQFLPPPLPLPPPPPLKEQIEMEHVKEREKVAGQHLLKVTKHLKATTTIAHLRHTTGGRTVVPPNVQRVLVMFQKPTSEMVIFGVQVVAVVIVIVKLQTPVVVKKKKG